MRDLLSTPSVFLTAMGRKDGDSNIIGLIQSP
jgi:hypothetical protein